MAAGSPHQGGSLGGSRLSRRLRAASTSPRCCTPFQRSLSLQDVVWLGASKGAFGGSGYDSFSGTKSDGAASGGRSEGSGAATTTVTLSPMPKLLNWSG